MKHMKIASIILAVILVGLVIAGCAGTEAQPSATVAPQAYPTTMPLSCPTNAPLSCPTAPACPIPTAIQYSSIENSDWINLAGRSAIDITFEPGDKCTVSAYSSLSAGMHYFQTKVTDQAHAVYFVIFQTLDEGKTLEDLLTYPQLADQPSWAHSFIEIYMRPSSNSINYGDFPTGQIYFSCFTTTDTGFQRILDYGPIEVK